MKTLLAFVAAATALAAAPAAAQNPAAGNAPVAVSYADLDLRTDAGLRALDRRIRAAVQEACGPTSSFDPAGTNQARECRTETLERLSTERRIAVAAARQAGPIELAADR